MEEFENSLLICDFNFLIDFVIVRQYCRKSESVTIVCGICGRGGRQLWVIHQILFASKLEVSSSASNSAGARVSTVSPGAPGADVSMSYEGSSVLNLTVGTNTKFPGKFMFAFRAIRFKFDSAGKLLGKPLDDAGKHMPVHRGDDDGLYDDEAAQIRDLFLEEPPDDEEKGEWDVQRLPIEEDTNEV